jgi:hypothetical protein
MQRTKSWLIAMLTAVALGVWLGSVVPTVSACEDDECEGGTSCADNAGGGTQCDMISSSLCATKPCI